MDNNIVNFPARVLQRDAKIPQEFSPLAHVADNVAMLVRPKMKSHIYTERLRVHLDSGAEIFFEKMVSLGQVTIVNVNSKIDFESSLEVESDTGEVFSFSVDGFLRLTMPNPAEVTLENIDRILLEVLEAFQVRIGMRQDDTEFIDGLFVQDEITEANMHLFFPEKIPVIRDMNHPDDDVYSCFFSESTHYVASVTAEYFMNPGEATVLELMCLARNDFVEEGNSLKDDAFMELELATRNDVKISKISLKLLEKILADAIVRKSPITQNFAPSVRIQKYCDTQVFPKVNPMIYEEYDGDDEE